MTGAALKVARWAKWLVASLTFFLSTEEIVKYFLHHPDIEHVEAILPVLPPPSLAPPDEDLPPGQQMLMVPRGYEEQRRQATFAALFALGLGMGE